MKPPPPASLRCATSLGLAALLAACSAWAPREHTTALHGLVVPAAWATSADDEDTTAQAPAAWWLRFGDPLLAQLAAQAVQANTRVQTAQAALRQARALRDAGEAAVGPTLDLSAAAQRGRAGDAPATNRFDIGLDGGLELWPDRSGLQASEASARARAASLADVQVAIATELGLAYIDLRSSQARLRMAQAGLDSQLQTLQIVQWRQQAGLVTQLEHEQALAAVAQTRAQLPLLRTRIDQGAHAIAVLTGQSPGALRAQLAQPGVLPVAERGLALSLPADTLRQRADVRAAELDVQAAFSRVDQADAARRPRLRLGGSLGLGALTLGALGSSGALAASVLGSVAWPVFDSGAAQAQVRVQQAAYDSARVQYQATVLAALLGVENTLVSLRDHRAQLLQLQQAAGAAGRAAKLARQRFGSGLVDFQTVLDTQRNELSTQDAVASAQADISADHMRLFQALGGGWTPDTPPAAPADTRAGPP